MPATDTIVALSTPPGRSGIGVIRLSGPRALEILRVLVSDSQLSPEPNRVNLKRIRDPETGEFIDEALVTYFKTPHSFTGDDIVELSCHGSPVLLRQIVDLILGLDARVAGPGEFTLRSVAAGRLNLTQAEAIRDLINAQTTAAARQAARQMRGELSLRLQPIKDALIDIIVILESSLEFVEDDLPEIALERLDAKVVSVIEELEQLSSTFNDGRLLKEGLKVALVGRPNVGKSSLFNRLLSADRAIVTDVPGTTRDSLTEVTNLEGIPVLFADTAGVRATQNEIENLGVERTRRTIADADLAVLVVDGSQPLTNDDIDVLAEIGETPFVVAVNKMDLDNFSSDGMTEAFQGVAIQDISARTGSGLGSLKGAILAPFATRDRDDAGLLITDARHFDLLQRAVVSLRESRQLFEKRATEELVLVGLHHSLTFLGEITGETTSEDILSRVFATFCIGK